MPLSSYKKDKSYKNSFSLQEALASTHPIVDLCSKDSPPKWVELSAKLCLEKKAKALVTAPLSKVTIKKSGYAYAKGHTEILKKVCNSSDVFMLFLGKNFNVFLLTGHIPLKKVPTQLTSSLVEKGINIADSYLKKINNSKKPLALLGVNPHAGEEGILGLEEIKLFKKVLKKVRKKSVLITDPLTPDVAFLKKNWKKYSCFICPYHDQALIPFKALNDHTKSVQITLGLPFLRVGVSHGTAYDIFNKNKASSVSMLEAFKIAVKTIN